MANNLKNDIDSEETKEWLDALTYIIKEEGTDRAQFLIEKMIDETRQGGGAIPFNSTTSYVNTIPTPNDPSFPGDLPLERRIRSIIRWNALMTVLRASKKGLELGGHISSFSSSATIYDVAFNHFFKGPSHADGADLIFLQGHTSPGMYARSFLEGRFTQDQLCNFRQEIDGKGLSSYPHPRLMPSYWQFPTVSMGLGPISAIYQAKFLKYLTDRGIKDCSKKTVYAFLGDGEMDEPESLGAIGVAAREKLDNLVFTINCNLQRLDGPVRGNGKIIQELESTFRGAGWEVIKVIWGHNWDPLLAQDTSGKLLQLMNETLDGEYQNLKEKGGAYTREHFFGKYPETAKLVEGMTDEDISNLSHGGHDPLKIYSAYQKAKNTTGKPCVLLIKTVKGYGQGVAGEAQNIAHSVKKFSQADVKNYRDRFALPISDEHLEELPFFVPDADSQEIKYMKEHRETLGGVMPQRLEQTSVELKIPELSSFKAVLAGSNNREISTTMAFVRVLTTLLKDKEIGKHIVPIVPDEARTFGMEGLFRQVGIYSREGQKYTPQDREQVSYYKEDTKGQILQEGINELGAMSDWVAAATSYSTNDMPMIPFFILYSIFGFQRFGDMAWSAGDQRARGFIIGATSGRTTLNGEGLQHQDGQSHIHASVIPSCITYDPTYGYEVAVIVQDGIKRMYQDKEDVYYYMTVTNENYVQPVMPEGVEEGIRKGIYKLDTVIGKNKAKVQLLSSGTIMLEVQKAAQILADDYGIDSTIFSTTSFNELTRDGQEIDRLNMLSPEAPAKKAYIAEQLEEGVLTIACTDYVKAYAEQVRAYIPGTYRVLGTDGFGRSDSRANLRRHFEVDAESIVVATLHELSKSGEIKANLVTEALAKFAIDTNKINPLLA